MIYCKLDFNNLSPNGQIAPLYCAGVGIFPVFSGLPPYTNREECSFLPNASIPPGKYWIVDRPAGGLRSRIIQGIKEFSTGNDYDEWFGLYRVDGLIDDQTWINGIERGSFRLHPLRPNGTGHSDGCITFFSRHDFDMLRHALLQAHMHPIMGSTLRAYGEVHVIGKIDAPCNV